MFDTLFFSKVAYLGKRLVEKEHIVCNMLIFVCLCV